MERTVTETLRNQFDSTFHMARTVVKACPDDLWAASCQGVPFWQRVFHFVYFMDYWLRERYDGSPWCSMEFGGAYTPELDRPGYEGLLIPRERMLEYLEAIRKKTARVFDALDDGALSVSAVEDDPRYTHVDVIVGQIRHVMYNIGYLNQTLREKGLPEAHWYAYNEPEGS